MQTPKASIGVRNTGHEAGIELARHADRRRIRPCKRRQHGQTEDQGRGDKLPNEGRHPMGNSRPELDRLIRNLPRPILPDQGPPHGEPEAPGLGGFLGLEDEAIPHPLARVVGDHFNDVLHGVTSVHKTCRT